MSIVKIASFGYKIFVVLSSTQSIYNVGSLRQVRVKNVFFVVQYLTKKRIICIVEQISNSCRLFVVGCSKHGEMSAGRKVRIPPGSSGVSITGE